MSESTVASLLDRLHRCQQDERRRIARELHDVVAPMLAVVLHDLELSAALRHVDPERGAAKVDAAADHLRAAADELRGITAALREHPAVHSLADELRAYLDRAGLTCPTQIRIPDPEPVLTAPLRRELYLILREAVRNAHRHAQATEIVVDVRADGDLLAATVRDDGVGVPGDLLVGSGVAAMRERAAALGGRVTVGGGRSGGTEVTVSIPLPRSAR